MERFQVVIRDPEGVDVFVTYYIVLLVPVTGLLQNNQNFGGNPL